uniref:Treslin N-terminal domain-containing protein n=1 Tax=Ascaris lumbricoides TaxID=6252 RepID=A0A9J2P3F3_ASCLU
MIMREAPTAIDIPLSALDAAYREQQRTTILRISARSTATPVCSRGAICRSTKNRNFREMRGAMASNVDNFKATRGTNEPLVVETVALRCENTHDWSQDWQSRGQRRSAGANISNTRRARRFWLLFARAFLPTRAAANAQTAGFNRSWVVACSCVCLAVRSAVLAASKFYRDANDVRESKLGEHPMESHTSNFEEVAFALFQALNPGKKLCRDQVPYKQLRGLIGELVGSSSMVNGEEKNGSSTLDVSDDSSSRVSFEESVCSRSKGMLRGMTASRKAISTSKVPKHARTMLQIRARRRNASYTPRYTSFECTEEELRAGFGSFYEKMLDGCSTSTECYHVLINSLNNFFTHNTWTNNVDKLVNEFMHDSVLMSCTELGAKYDRCGESRDGERRLREYELMALIEIHLLNENCASAVENSDVGDAKTHVVRFPLLRFSFLSFQVLNKLRFIYFAGDVQRLRDFLDETISDQFAHIKPQVVARIYEELCMKVPFDLQNYANEESKCSAEDFELENAAVLQRRASQTESLDRLINGDDSDASMICSTNGTNSEMHKKFSMAERSFRRSHKTPHQHSTQRTPSKMCNEHSRKRRDTGTRKSLLVKDMILDRANWMGIVPGRKNECWEGPSEPKAEKHSFVRRSFSVPETPGFRMKKKRPHPDNTTRNDKNPVVPQTPISKMSRCVDLSGGRIVEDASARRLRPLSAVLKKSEEHLATTDKASSSGVALLVKCAKKRSSSQLNISPNSFLPSPLQQSPPPCASRPPTRSQSGNVVKINLQQKFARCNSEVTGNDSPILSQPSSPRVKGKNEFTLEKGVVERYRRRLDNIRHSARKTDKNESERLQIFYGRCTSRRNLFDEEDGVEGSSGVLTRSSSCATLQKNRSGRSVHTNCVYMAHALLNVHNMEPLSPCKAPKQSPFKLHRLVRPASKSDRRRLSKLRIRIQRERIGMPATIVNSRTVEDSPQSPSEP